MIKPAPFAKWRFPSCPKRKIRGKLRANRGIRYFPRRIIPLPSPSNELPLQDLPWCRERGIRSSRKDHRPGSFQFSSFFDAASFARILNTIREGGRRGEERLLHGYIWKSIESKGGEMHEDAWEKGKVYLSSIEKRTNYRTLYSIRFRVGGG